MGKRKYDGDMIIVKGGKFFYQKNNYSRPYLINFY